MGTRFEAVLFGEPEREVRAAGEAALDEIEHLHDTLNLFSKDSFLSFLNARAFSRPVRVDPDLFDLLVLCNEVNRQSRGAFDITVGALMACWGFHGGEPASPLEEELDRTRANLGCAHLILDREEGTVRFLKPYMRLDLGAVAKGYALDRAVEILKLEGIKSALLHGGTSSIAALGAPPGEAAWKVALRHPRGDGALIKVVALKDAALSVSAQHGRAFVEGGKRYGHVMDPRTGAPAQGAVFSAVLSASAALGDAWSTALLASGRLGLKTLTEAGVLTALLCEEEAKGLRTTLAGPASEHFKEPKSEPGIQEDDHADERS
jgi:thiamine biosynthesis lipoprotein